MKRLVRGPLRKGLRRLGYDVVRVPPGDPSPAVHPADFDEHTVAVIERIEGLTLTSPERIPP